MPSFKGQPFLGTVTLRQLPLKLDTSGGVLIEPPREMDFQVQSMSYNVLYMLEAVSYVNHV